MATRIWLSLALLAGVLVAACDSGPGDSPLAQTPPSPTPALGASVAGEARLADGSESSGIQVYIPGTRFYSLTDSEGLYTLTDVAPGLWRVLARAPGYEPKVVQEALTIAAADLGQTVHLEPVTLETRKPRSPADAPAADARFGSITGQVRVLDAGALTSGTLPAEVIVELKGTPYRTSTTSDGTFLLWNLPADDYTLVARMDGAAPATAEARVLPGEQAGPIVLTIQSASIPTDGRIAGEVALYDTDGNPTNDFDLITVRVMGTPRTATLGPDGSFLLEGLERRPHIITASGAGYGQSAPVEADLTSEGAQSVLLVLMAAAATSAQTATIQGFAIKGDKDETEDMSGIGIALTGSSSMATTNKLGQYTLKDVPPGTYQLVASAQGYQDAGLGPFEVTAGQQLDLEGILLKPDREAPVVLQTDPADGMKDVMIQREIPIMVRFSHKMTPDSLRQAVRIEPEVAYKLYTGSEHPDTDYDLMRIVLYGSEQEPVAQFQTRYTLTIGTQAQDFEGVAMENPYRFSIRTGDPAVIDTLPEDDGTKNDMGPRTPVVVFFNAPMDHTSLDQSVLKIRPPLDTTPNLSIADDPATGWTSLHISGIWKADTEYKITVERRARTRGRDSLMNTPYTFEFKTAKLRTYRQPTVPTAR